MEDLIVSSKGVWYAFSVVELWDTIVIGAGVGGLIAAAHLVKAGLRVSVLERNPHIGGTAYAYDRGGFIFPMGPLGFSHPGLVKTILEELEIGEDLKFSRVHYRIHAFGLDLPLSLHFSELARELAKSFPADAKAMEYFFRDINELISKQKTDPNRSRFNQKQNISASDYLHNRIKDMRLRRILGSLGTREPYSGLSLLAAMWNLMSHEGIWFPEEGMQSFCKRLGRAVIGDHENRGEIRLNKEVVRIRVNHGEVRGVTLQDGTQLNSSSVISNADYKTAFLKLLEPGMIPPEWYRAISGARQTGSVFQVCLGVDARKADLSVFKKATRLIYRRHVEHVHGKETLDWTAQEIDAEAFASQELEVSLWGEKDRERVSAEGRAPIVIRTEAEYHHFAKYRSGWRQRSPGYHAYKTRLAQALIHEIDHLIPGLEKAVSVMDVATPLTFEDQGGRSGGAVAGWSWDYEYFRDDQSRELILTPIRGLYMAGYQAFSALFMGGIPTAMESGKRAARAVLEKTGPIDRIMIPGTN